MFLADTWLLLIGVPALMLWAAAWAAVAILANRGRLQRLGAVRFSSVALIRQLSPSLTLLLRRVVQALRVVTVALLLIAVARPQTGRKQVEAHTEGIDIILAVDTSGSMQALDLDSGKSFRARRNRLAVVKDVVAQFIEKRDNDQIGMVVFGTEAFTQCPLTLDHGIVATFLERVEIGVAGEATALGGAIGTAVKRLKESEAKSKVIVLLTDGRQTAGSLSPKTAAQLAKTYDVKIYTIGAGTRDKAPFPVRGLFGFDVEWRDEPIDERALKEVARITGGAYFRAEDASALEEVYEQIDAMEKTEIKTKSYMEYDERFGLFVIPALVLLLLEILLLGTRLRKIP